MLFAQKDEIVSSLQSKGNSGTGAMSIDDSARWLSRVILAVAIIIDRMGLKCRPWPACHCVVCRIGHDLDGAIVDIRYLESAWLLHSHCGVGARHRRGFAPVQHSAF